MDKKSIKSEITKYYDNLESKTLDESEKKYKFESNNSNKIVHIFDNKTNRLLGTYKYQTVGIFNKNTSIWNWAWTTPFIDRSEYSEIIKIKKYSKELMDNYNKYKPNEVEELHFYTSTDCFFCTTETISLLKKLVLYLSKGLWIITNEKTIENFNIVIFTVLTNKV